MTRPTKQLVVLFNDHGAHVLVNPENTDWLIKHNANVLVDPDLRDVLGYPPEYWKLEKGKVILQDESERPDTNHLKIKTLVAQQIIEVPGITLYQLSQSKAILCFMAGILTLGLISLICRGHL